jgi:hypothetical protein
MKSDSKLISDCFGFSDDAIYRKIRNLGSMYNHLIPTEKVIEEIRLHKSMQAAIELSKGMDI